ncbi:MAG TPA: antibiotic biosynthesis monooxygenase [Steroidobacteraceae bacterium]|jgi:quinol monooxygenase YgiN|nr:antibiotic biosynthesis monooxygenase [Steroidobacteraceae bacterium]
MITFIAHVRVKAHNAEAFEALMAEVAARTHEHEPGVAYYECSLCVDDPEIYVVIEVYRDVAVHSAHMKSDWVTQSLPKALQLMEGRPEIRQYVTRGAEPVRQRAKFS